MNSNHITPEPSVIGLSHRTPKPEDYSSTLKTLQAAYGSVAGPAATSVSPKGRTEGEPKPEPQSSLYHNYVTHRPPNPSDPPIFKLEEKRRSNLKENPLVKVHEATTNFPKGTNVMPLLENSKP